MGGKVPADVEAFEVGEFGKGLEDVVGVLVATAGVPDGAWQEKVAQMGELGQPGEFGGWHDGTSEVDAQDAHLASRQLTQVADGLMLALEGQYALPTQHPLGYVAF